MTQYEYLKKIYGFFEKPNNESLKKSLRDVHVKGLFSLVIDGTDHGKLTRVFISTKKIKPQQIQLHSHRYGIKLTPLFGEVTEHVLLSEENGSANVGEFKASMFEYKSPLNGGNGLKYLKDIYGEIYSQTLPIGTTSEMEGDDIHTISCSKNAIWIVEEQGFTTDRSLVVGTPFITDNLYNEPKQFEVNDNFQKVKSILKSIINSYDNL